MKPGIGTIGGHKAVMGAFFDHPAMIQNGSVAQIGV